MQELGKFSYLNDQGHPLVSEPTANNGLGRPVEQNGKEGRYLLADGPKTLAEFNPKGVLRFQDRVCETCDGPIMGHYLLPLEDVEKRYTYWCDKEGTRASTGMKI